MREGRRVVLPRGALAGLRRADPGLAAVIERVGPFRMRAGSSSCDLEALVRSIVYQQLSGKAAATIFGRFRSLFEEEDTFPSAAAILKTHHARLRKAGLSRQKQAALRDLCRRACGGELPLGDLEGLDDEVLVARLCEVRGIGRWSAQMFLMFHLGRLDVWPTGDLGVQKALATLRGASERPRPAEMERLGEIYRPYRSVAAWYLWRSLEGEAQL